MCRRLVLAVARAAQSSCRGLKLLGGFVGAKLFDESGYQFPDDSLNLSMVSHGRQHTENCVTLRPCWHFCDVRPTPGTRDR